MTSSRLVSVVIPAYNAHSTLDATLRSVRAQEHSLLDIIVVDDGSTDATNEIAARHATVDTRIRIFRQANAGLAAARNVGWRNAHSDVIAFIDADDLWAPGKIRRQLEVLEASGSRVGLVYCGNARIDAKNIVTAYSPIARHEGDVLDEVFSNNFIGNGSTSMLTRQALERAGGYDPALRAAGAQGCEDYLLQCRVAEDFHFAAVPEHLVGYRYLPGNMSSDRPRMLRSWMLVVEEMKQRHPGRVSQLHRGLRAYSTWLLYDAVGKGETTQVRRLCELITRFPLTLTLSILFRDIPHEALNRVRIRLGNVRSRKHPDTRTTRLASVRSLPRLGSEYL